MIEKKTRYAVLVKEMFLPTIDRLKKQELLSLQSEKQLRKISPKSPQLDENRLIGSDSEGKKKVYKKKKFKENPLGPKPLKQSENVNDLLLNSIKAKLAVLDHKNN